VRPLYLCLAKIQPSTQASAPALKLPDRDDRIRVAKQLEDIFLSSGVNATVKYYDPQTCGEKYDEDNKKFHMHMKSDGCKNEPNTVIIENVAAWCSLFGRPQQLLDGSQTTNGVRALLASPRGTRNAPRRGRASRIWLRVAEDRNCSKCSKNIRHEIGD
jgi:hypothetical protein